MILFKIILVNSFSICILCLFPSSGFKKVFLKGKYAKIFFLYTTRNVLIEKSIYKFAFSFTGKDRPPNRLNGAMLGLKV